MKFEVNSIQIINNVENRSNAHEVMIEVALKRCKHCEELSLQRRSKLFREHLSEHFATMKSWKSQNYCDNERISIIFEALKCAHSVLQFWLDEWKSYEIVEWCARCETTVQITKSWTTHFRKHLNWRFDTNLTTIWSFKFQNYCDNESISVILAALNCAHSVVQLCLDRWKLYEIVDCDAKCIVIARCWNVLRWSWHMFRLRTWILN